MSYIFRAKEFRTKKKLGQNFLIDKDVIQKILDVAEIKKDETVVEIGGGIGFVTEQLVNLSSDVNVIELDDDAIEMLEKINCEHLNIIHNDILKTDISQFNKNNGIKIVANIPYYITSPIIAHLLGEIDDLENKNRQSIKEIVMMVQWEVAKRLVAKAGDGKDFGLLTVLANFWADVELVQKVKARSFYPAPKVDSAIVKFTIKDKPLLNLTDYKFFRKFIQAAFAQRRKNIKNSLMNAGYAKDAVIKALENKNIEQNMRAEALPLETLGELSEELKKLL